MANYFQNIIFSSAMTIRAFAFYAAAQKFANGCEFLKGKNRFMRRLLGASGLNQGLNMRDSGLDVFGIHCARRPLMKALIRSSGRHQAMVYGRNIPRAYPVLILLSYLTPGPSSIQVVD